MKKIVILGTAPSSLGLAPFGGDWEIWACSPGTYAYGEHIDKFFELHRYEPGQPWFSEGYCDFLENFDGEVIMSKQVDKVKNCTLLPYEALVKKYGPYFFTSSIAWMMAMAIEAGADKIALYGVDMAATTEYHDQRLGCQYFALLAKSMGIEVGVPPESDLLRPAPLYGVCENSHAWIKQTARARELADRLRNAEQEIAERSNEIHFLRGAMDDQDWNLHSWFGNVDSLGQEFTEPAFVPALRVISHPLTGVDGKETDDGRKERVSMATDVFLDGFQEQPVKIYGGVRGGGMAVVDGEETDHELKERVGSAQADEDLLKEVDNSVNIDDVLHDPIGIIRVGKDYK